MKSLIRLSAVLLAALPCLAPAADAPAADDGYPSKAVRIVVPFAAGGSTDVVARIIAEKLSQQFKQPFLVDNRAGASGNIG
ncbi:protein bugT, partial [Cupriavidus basilensis OR16]